MKAQFVVLPDLLPASTLQLGSFVSSTLTPQTDAFLPPSSILLPSDFFISNSVDFSTSLSSSNDNAFNLSLTQLVNTHYKRTKDASVRLSGKRARWFELTSQRRVFGTLCGHPEAQRWLEEGISLGSPTYLIVGFKTIFDPSIDAGKTNEYSVGQQVTVPVSKIVTGGADVLGLGSAIDPSVGAEVGSKQGAQTQYTAPGEMIWAIAYKKVQFKMWKKKSASTAMLDKAVHWTLVASQRGKADEGEDEIEADLGDLEDEEELESAVRGNEGPSDEDAEYLIPPDLASALEVESAGKSADSAVPAK